MPLNLSLMQNNITRDDLDAVIKHLQQDDPILTQSKNVQAFEEASDGKLTFKTCLK